MNCYIYAFGVNMLSHWEIYIEPEIETELLIRDNYYAYKYYQDYIICFVHGNIRISPSQLLLEIKNKIINRCGFDNIDLHGYIIRPGNRHQPAPGYCTGCEVYNTNCTSGEFIINYVNDALSGRVPGLPGEVQPLIITDPLIIILTEEEINRLGTISGQEEWVKAISNQKGNYYDDNIEKINKAESKQSPRIIEYKNGEYTVLFVKENDYNQKKIDDILNKIINRWGTIDEKYVAVHALDTYLENKERFEKKVNYICNFNHVQTEPDKSFCDLLLKFLDRLDQNASDTENICKEIIEKIKLLAVKPQQKIAILKHRINNILGPLDMEMQRLKELAVAGSYAALYEEINIFRRKYKVSELENKIDEIKAMIKEVLNEINYNEAVGNLGDIENKIDEVLKNIYKLLKYISSKNVNKVYDEMKKSETQELINSWLREIDGLLNIKEEDH